MYLQLETVAARDLVSTVYVFGKDGYFRLALG